MLEKKEHISIITDEYGCLRGIVTMEGVIETMLGEEHSVIWILSVQIYGIPDCREEEHWPQA